MQNTWMVVIPPAIVVVLATLTHRVIFSLLMGIMSASLVLHSFDPAAALSFSLKRFWQITELGNLVSWSSFWTCSNLFICAFLVILGVLMVMLHNSGASYAYGNFMIKKLKTAGGAERSSLLLSTVFFIDDYFSCLAVGSVMQPITDRFRVPRAKLALFVNVVAAPLALIVPLSSWVAYVMGQFSNAGISATAQATTIMIADPFNLYLHTIPFLLYALVVVASVWYMSSMHISYGLLQRHKDLAKKTGDVFGGKTAITHRMLELSADKKATASLIDFLLPITGLFVAVIGWILYSGGWWLCGGNNTLLQALAQANIYAGLFGGSLVTTISACLFFLARKKIAISDIFGFIKEGSGLMGSSIVALFLIWTFSSILSKDLETGRYIAHMLIGHINSALLPVMFFLMSALISTLMGTSWGTMGMLIPLALHMVPEFLHVSEPFYLNNVPLLLPILGAIISGSVVSNHLSPISDVMMMSSMSTGSYHLDVLKSHISLVLPTVFSCAIGFLVAGYAIASHSLMVAALVSLATAVIVNFALLHVLHVLSNGMKK